MSICSHCGVELDHGMSSCPLCDTPVLHGGTTQVQVGKPTSIRQDSGENRQIMHRVLWQVTAVLLLSGIVATLVINLAIDGRITWSIYPITICLIALAYAALMALWEVRFIFRLLGGWAISSLILAATGYFLPSEWPLHLALPILCTLNLVLIMLHLWLGRLKMKGLNVLAVVFVLIAVFSLTLESIISLYRFDSIELGWSVIVAACLLPVTAALLFMHFKTRDNADLQKIFHV